MLSKSKRVKDPQAIKDARRPYCELCGRAGATQVHHIIFRGQGGHDTADNLISLCVNCHDDAHGKGRNKAITPKAVLYRAKEGKNESNGNQGRD